MKKLRETGSPAGDWPPETIELLEACKRVHALALKWDGIAAGTIEYIRIETVIDRELVLINRHLYRFARAILMHWTGVPRSGGSSVQESIEDEALEIVLPLFGKRKSTGRREMVHVICLLFRNNPDPGPNDVLKHLKKTVRNTLSGARRQKLREQNPIYFSTSRKVKRYVDNDERYERRDGTVYDRHIEYETPNLRLAEAEDLVRLCGAVSPMPSTVAQAVDTIFECLSDGNHTFRAAVKLKVLQAAVYQILEPVLIDKCHARMPVTAENMWLVTEAEMKFRETACRMETDYEWRKDFDEKTRGAISEAALEYLWDKIHRDKIESQFRYLASYLPRCTQDVYQREYKGSFQHFIITFEERWRESCMQTRRMAP